jgi:predicted transcriptional regulator YdeE
MKYSVVDYDERFYIGVEFPGGVNLSQNPNISNFWNDFLRDDLPLLQDIPSKNLFIGLECYPPDFKDTHTFDYYALVETNQLEHKDGFVSKKLPKGKYILFEIEFDDLMNEMQRAYQFAQKEKMPIHYGFDYEQYLMGEDYTKPGAKLQFVIKLESKEE